MAAVENDSTRPDWLNEDFLKAVIRNDLKAKSIECIKVGDVKVEFAVPKGENYSSDILRVTVTGDFGQDCAPKLQNGTENGNGYRDRRKYILKALHQTGDMKVFIEDSQVHDREVDMLQNILPTFQNILEKAGLPVTFAARILHNLPEFNVIAMEDLSEKGFVLANRHRGANLDECKVLYRKQARLHAASMKYYEANTLKDLDPVYFKSLMAEGETEKAKEVKDSFFGAEILRKKVVGMAGDVLERPGYEREHRLFMDIADIAHDLTLDTFSYKPDNIFNAHLHGDCWLNNMLFKYDTNGRPADVLLLDLQLSYYNSVANDFMYFFLSSASDEVRRRHYEELTRFYFDHLTETLERVGYEGTHPTYDQFQEELMKASSMFLMHLSYFLPILKAHLSAEQMDRSTHQQVDNMEAIIELSDENRTNPLYLDSLFASIDMLRAAGIVERHEKLCQEYSRKKK